MCFFSLLDTQTLENDGSSLACSPLTSSSWGCLVTLEDTPILSPRTATGHGMGELVKVGMDPSCTLVVDERMFAGSTDKDLKIADIQNTALSTLLVEH